MTGRKKTVEDVLREWYATKTKRNISTDRTGRLSCSDEKHEISENYSISFLEWDKLTLLQANGESIAGASIEERFRTIARRYGEIAGELGVMGPSGCMHIFMNPKLLDENKKPVDFKLRIKYINAETSDKLKHTKGEIWKNILFGKFLDSQNELGWTLNRDWTCDHPIRVDEAESSKEVQINLSEEPFYLVMLKGDESVKQQLQREQTRAPLDDLINFVDEYSFDKNHMRKDSSGEILGNYINLIVDSLQRYSNLKPGWSEKLEKIRDHIKGNLQDLVKKGKDLQAYWVVSDGKTENIVNVKDGNESILAWVDQGQRKEVLEAWLKKINPNKDTFSNQDYYLCFWGAPQVYMGHMNFSIQIGEHIPETVKDYFASKIDAFVNTGVWNDEKKKGVDEDAAKFSSNMVNLGTLQHVMGTYYTNKTYAWESLAETVMNSILTNSSYTNFYNVISPIKNIQEA